MAGAVENGRASCRERGEIAEAAGSLKEKLAGPTLMAGAKLATVCEPASSLPAAGSPATVKVGASLTALTVMVKVWAALVLTLGGTPLPLSVRVTLKVAVPLASAAVW